jgi:concanavalin A-like lectin/glucanase superfamily protein/List-Bact-rpt repeat protein/flagellar hook capping protein FlgD
MYRPENVSPHSSLTTSRDAQGFGWSICCARLILGLMVIALLPVSLHAAGFTSVTSLQQVPISASTGEKPQSKCWTNGGYWFAVFSTASGTNLYRLDGTAWTNILALSTATDAHPDAKAVGNVTHILLYRGTSSQLVSVEYLSGTHAYQLWSTRPATANITLDGGVETATIDVDSYGRMWLASDAVTDVNVRWSDPPYSSWSSPITIGTGIDADDISVVTALPALGKVGVLWSNQTTRRFGFRTHTDGADPATWTADEVPASQSALNVGAGMADDHLHVAIATDGTLYAAVKTSYDTPGYPKIALLLRHPSGAWDNLYEVDQSGTRGIVLLNEAINEVTVCYTQSEGSNDIVYKSSALSPISFGTRQTLMSGALNEPSSTKQNFTGEVVILASTVPTSNAVSVLAKPSNGTGDVPADASLLAYYMMDEGGGASLRDTSGSGNHGEIIGGPAWVSGIEGLAQSFDGSSQYDTAANSASLNPGSAITISAWFKCEQTAAATQRIVSKGVMNSTDGYELSLASSGKVFTRFNQKTNGDIYRINSTTSYPLNTGAWMHAAATYDGATIKLYINGVQEGSLAWAGATIGSNTNPLSLGRQNDGLYYFKGKMDEVRVYNHALDVSEIQALASHTISATAGTGGVISPTGNVSVVHNGNQTFTITTDPGYALSGVTVDGVSQGAIGTYTFNNVLIDHTIVASFASTGSSHTITATAAANGSISPSGAVSVADHGSRSFTITPNGGYHVGDVLVDGGSVGAVTSYTFNDVTTDHTIAASFAVNAYTLTLSTAGAGTAVKNPDQTAYSYHTGVTLTATPAGGSAFIGWSGSLSGTTNPITVYTDSNMTVVANFGQSLVGYWAMDEGTGTVLADSSAFHNTGTIFGSPSWVTGQRGSALVFDGTTTYATVADTPSLRIANAITLAAWVKPALFNTQDLIKKATNGSVNGYELSLAAASGNPPRRPFVRFNQATSADAYRLSSRVTSEYPTNGTWMHLAATYDGATIKLYINGVLDTTKAVSFTIASNNLPLSIGGESNGARKYTGQMDDARVYNRALSASEVQALVTWTHTITATSGAHGSISPSGAVVVSDGASQPFVITADPGYHVAGILVDGNPAGEVSSYTFANVTANHTISASFAINTFTLTVTPPVHGTVTLDPPGGTYDSNSVVVATAVPDAEYGFAGWSGDASGPTNPASVTMNSNKTITASFVRTQYTIAMGATNRISAGINTLALDGVDSRDTIAPPPPPTNYVYLYYLLAPGQPMPNYAVDIRRDEASLAAQAKRWALRAVSDQVSTATTIQVTASNLPSGFKPVVYDLQTGKYQDLRMNPLLGYMTPPSETPYGFSLLLGDSTKPAVSLIHPNGGELLAAGRPDTIRWSSSDGTGVLRHYISYSLTGASPYTFIDSTNGGADSLIWTPGISSSSARIKVVARDSVLNEQEDISNATFGIGNTITATAGAHGSISPSGVVIIPHASSPGFTSTPETGYRVDSLIVDGVKTDSTSSYTFTNVTTNHSIRATFAPNTVQVTVQTNPASLSITVDGVSYTAGQTFTWSYGSDHTIGTTTPQGGAPGIRYVWNSWSDGGAITHTVAPTTDLTFTASFTTQYYLTMNSDPNGTVSPASNWFNAGLPVAITATPLTHYHFALWSGSGSGSYSGTSNPGSVTMNGPVTETASFAHDQVQVTIQTDPAGISFTFDGVTYSSSQVLTVELGSTHTLSTTTPQSGGLGIQYLWNNWSDGGALSHTITPGSNLTFTATFTTQYSLTMLASGGGSVSPPNAWYNAGAPVLITATPNTGKSFGGWNGSGSGSYSGTDNPATVTMNGPITETASFVTVAVHVTVQTNPTIGPSFQVDGVTYTIGQIFTWEHGSSHTIATSTPQSGSPGTRYLWSNWSDAGTISHTIIPVGDMSVTSNFTTNYFLTLAAIGGGSVSPANDWHASGEFVSIRATPNTGHSFNGWKGSGAGSYTGMNNPASVTMSAPVFDTALFSINMYTLTVGTAGSGTAIRNPDQGSYGYHTPVTLTATPAAGWHFTGWSGAISDTANPVSVFVDSAMNITANFSQSLVTMQISVQKNWNIVSLPAGCPDSRKRVLFPSAVSPAFGFDAQYVISDTMRSGRSYWLKFLADTSTIMTATQTERDTIDVLRGWNMIGSIYEPIPATSITSDPPALITSHFFGYNGGYHTAATIYPGKGYWVKVAQDGKLFLQTPSANLPSTLAGRIRMELTNEAPPAPPEETPSALPGKPREFNLDEAYPDPFNPSTTIGYQLPQRVSVKIDVYNILGERVSTLVNETQDAGYYTVRWDGRNQSNVQVTSGVYLYRLTAGDFTRVKRMLLLK